MLAIVLLPVLISFIGLSIALIKWVIDCHNSYLAEYSKGGDQYPESIAGILLMSVFLVYEVISLFSREGSLSSFIKTHFIVMSILLALSLLLVFLKLKFVYKVTDKYAYMYAFETQIAIAITFTMAITTIIVLVGFICGLLGIGENRRRH